MLVCVLTQEKADSSHSRPQKRRRHIFGQRRQCNYNYVHGFIYLVSSVPTTNHMDESRLGNHRPPPWLSFKDNPVHYALEKLQHKKKKTLAPH